MHILSYNFVYPLTLMLIFCPKQATRRILEMDPHAQVVAVTASLKEEVAQV